MAVPFTFVDGTVATASEVNANYTNIENFLGYAEITSGFNHAINGTYTDVTSLAVTVTVPSGSRKIKITVFARDMYSSNAGAIEQAGGIFEGGTLLQEFAITTGGANEKANVNIIYVGTASAGSHTYKVALKQGGAGTQFMDATATAPAFILCEQI